MPNDPAASHDAIRDAAILAIATRDLLFEIDSFEPRRSGADFREVAVWMVEAALTAAYEAGRGAGRQAGCNEERKRRTPTRCQCPACGREIRITPVL
ncbi:MAG: hypothetical protein JNM94_12215 [Phycisphaerae bacterium]|nr:hypothetical protein [Phycisphaerae bacterium]